MEYLKEIKQKDSLTKKRKTREKTLYQKITKGWRVFKEVKRRFKQIGKTSIP